MKCHRCLSVWIGAAGLLALSAGGCGGPKMVPVQGVVRLDGQPLPKAIVAFYSVEDPGRTSNGFTDDAGRFEMTTFGQKDGVPPGEYKVTVEHWDKEAEPAREFASPVEAQQEIEKSGKRRKKEKPVVPAVYGDYQHTPLKIHIPADGPVTLELKATAP